MNVFKKVPIPICAVILGMFGLGNLLQSYSEGVRLLCGAVGAVLLVGCVIYFCITRWLLTKRLNLA